MIEADNQAQYAYQKFYDRGMNYRKSLRRQIRATNWRLGNSHGKLIFHLTKLFTQKAEAIFIFTFFIQWYSHFWKEEKKFESRANTTKKDITMLLCCRKIFKCKSLPSLVCPSNQLEWNQNWRIIQCAIEPSLDYSEYKKLKNSAEHIVVLFEEAH